MDDFYDILVEALEVFINHILFARNIYPPQIFKKRRIYNTPVFASIYPPLNTYLSKILKVSRELLNAGEFQCAEMLIYKEDINYERYRFNIAATKKSKSDDEILLDFEEQLRASLSMLTQRLKVLEKLPTDARFKILVHTTQSAFTKLTNNSHYQEFPWLRADLTPAGKVNQEISLLPLAHIKCMDFNINADIF